MGIYRPSLRDRLRSRARHALLERLRELVEPEGSRLPDLGGGTGAASVRFARGAREIVVREPDSRRISEGRSAGAPVVFSPGTAESLPFGPGQFDRVVSLMSFHHLSDAERALREAERVLVPEGRLVVYDLDPSTPRGRWVAFFEGRVMRHGFRFCRPAEIRRMARDAGFGDVREERFGAGAFVVARKPEGGDRAAKRL